MNTRTCIHCQKLKELETGFYYIKRSESYETRCKRCVAAYQRDRNKEDGGAATRKCYQKRKAEGKINPVPYMDKTPEQKRALVDAVKRWRAKNRERCNMEGRAGLQMRRSLPYQRAWPLIVHHYGGKCLSCGAGKVVFDHVIPLMTNGANTLENGQPLCLQCNTFKGQTNPSRDHRPDKGAWITELVRLNPWLGSIGSGHKQGWHKTAEGRKYWDAVYAQASEGMKMPSGEVGSSAVCGQQCAVNATEHGDTSYPLASDLASIITRLHENPPTIVM